MSEVEAKGEKVKRHDIRHDWHTVSMLTHHLVFSPKYRGKVLLGEVGKAAEEIIDEEKEKSSKAEYITLYTKLFHAHMPRT
jgi:REP element-mobilizing transposase RayT